MHGVGVAIPAEWGSQRIADNAVQISILHISVLCKLFILEIFHGKAIDRRWQQSAVSDVLRYAR
jgi:hypothetical protein